MTKPATTAATANTLHTDEGEDGLDCVRHPPHTEREGAIMQKLIEAVAANDRDAVFAIAQRLVNGAHAVGEHANKPEDKWMTVEEVAAHANVSRMTAWRWRNEQGLKFTKIGNVVRIRRSELDRFLNKHMQG